MPQKSEPINEEEKNEIHRAYRRLVNSVMPKMEPEDRTMVRKAYEMAVKAHNTQRRKSGEPYVLHPIEVARICATTIGLGPTAITCALLHDVVEDTEVTLPEIREQFGDRVSKIVDGLTKLDGTYNTENPQAENFKKVLSTLVEDVRVVLIKIADRLHNLRTIGSMPRHKQLKIAAETEYIYAPLAHRLGLYNVKTEFQDLCFKINDPETYHEIEQKLQDTEHEREIYINKFIKPLKRVLDENGIRYRIFGRPKSIFSIYNKIKTKNVAFEEIYDLFAVRIVVDVPRINEKAVCWQVYSLVTDVHKPIPERLKDWITTPKSNGYESLHTTVVGPEGRFVEVQIRSERMDEVAERGYAAHWKYKGVNDQPDMYESWLDSIREILENPNSDAMEFLSDFKTNLFQEEIYVYTPKGDLKVLPKGATALDLAFHIHTDIGYRCQSVKVNNRLVSMGYKLQNGDQVQVITNKNQKPSEDWLKLVVTGKARSKIRSALKEERRHVAEYGKEALQRKLDHLKVDYESSVERLVRFLDYPSLQDLYFDLATEKLNLNETLKNFKIEDHRLVEIEAEPKSDESKDTVPQPAPQRKTGTPSKLFIEGQPADQFSYQFANCCNPVQGDDIFAFLSSNAGVKIHRTTCPNATHLLANFGYRVMKAEWSVDTSSVFVADLVITGVDDGPGVIEKLTSTISSGMGINIRSFSISGDAGYFEGRMSLLVSNKDQLNLAIRNLQKLDNVSTVTRVE